MRKNLDPTTDRTAGEEILLTGRGLAVSGVVPPDLEIAFNGPDGERYSFASLRDWFVQTRFTSIWIFHSAVALTLAGSYPAASVTVPKYSLLLQSYDELGAMPNSGALGDRVPQLRNGDGPLAFEDQRTPQLMITTALLTGAGITTVVALPAGGAWRARVFGYSIDVQSCSALAVAAGVNLGIQGGAALQLNHQFFVPNPAVFATGRVTTGFRTLGNGILATAGNAVTINNGGAAFINGGYECSVLMSWERVA